MLDRHPDPLTPLRWIPFVASAALVAGAVHLSWEHPHLAAGITFAAAVVALAQLHARRRARRLLRSGDVPSILRRWEPTLARVPHAPTMVPLMTATAFAAFGWVGHARAALERAHRGPAWDEALEHRLFLDALLLTFEGERDLALQRAERLARLPLPEAGVWMQARVRTLRRAVGALVRAFAHRSEPDDLTVLEAAARTSPLIYWAMRYAAAVVAIDRGERERAEELLADAPAWPVHSSFRAFHAEILEIARFPRPASGA